MVTSSAEAPGELETVRQFVNTVDLEEGRDEVGAWLEARGVRPTAEVIGRAVEVREAIRILLARNNGLGVDVTDAAATLERAAGRAGLALRFAPDGSSRLEPEAAGADAVLGGLLVTVTGAMAEGTWERLKACRSDACRWAFYDHAKNRSRTWCSMAVCGNRQKARAYRQRSGSR